MMVHASPFARFAPPLRPASPLRRAITAATRTPEPDAVAALLPLATLPEPVRAAARAIAGDLIARLRAKPLRSGVQAFVQEYSLSSQEGVALMCLAEALLRIPDDATRDALIRDKLADGDWAAHVGDGRSLFVNAATWGLVVTGKLASSADDKGLSAALIRLVARLGEPVIRRGVDIAMRMMGEQFVTGETIEAALRRAKPLEARGFAYSYDMLGEAATTAADAARYYADYERAIHAIGRASRGCGVYEGPGISIKLSALHPRYSRAKAHRVMTELAPQVVALATLARRYDIGFNIDAEEADRLELSLDILQSLAEHPDLADWDGLGFVVQAYGKRCPSVIDFIVNLARANRRRIMVRLVKGAYWDAEIKRAQVDGLGDFPVFTRKVHTDLSYIACAGKLLAAGDAVFPQFATHNAQTLATIYAMAGPAFGRGDWEFQCLHGMGEPLYEEVVGADRLDRPCRIYAPVGTHETLLAYLVRRLLENGANSSFVHRISDPDVPVAGLIADPMEEVRGMGEPGSPHPAIALPRDILAPRRNSAGLDLNDESVLADLAASLRRSASGRWEARPAMGLEIDRSVRPVLNPADSRDRVGSVVWALERDAAFAVEAAAAAVPAWAATPADRRASILECAADGLEAAMADLMALAIREAGKSAANAVAEVREAVDFLRYYAAEARLTLSPEQRPLGPVVCISPWNFPLAIFTGQIAAALVAGNSVVAKPAEETPLIAAQAIAILHAAGVPKDVLQLVPGDGAIGAALVAAPETAGVLFTGSIEVARLIQRQLAGRCAADGSPIPLIAETGGQNAMIVDSSALTEQVVGDVLASAFDSAGQRCSALRLLCLQEEIADHTLAMLKGAVTELSVGPTDALDIDVGPVISGAARTGIIGHIEGMRTSGHAVHQVPLGGACAHGTFVPPTIIEIGAVSELKREVFGPVLHVLRFRSQELDGLVDQINATGYGLTFGLHTRLDETAARVGGRIEAGNLYINRNIIGAVVGVQPFGGRGLSGTGPKAGGPLYLSRLVANPRRADHGLSDRPALAAFADWLENRGHASLAAGARAMGTASRWGLEIELPGPVGERNVYSCHARGRVLLKARTREGLYEQLAAVFATGNRAVIAAGAGKTWLDGLPARVAEAVAWAQAGSMEPELTAALVEHADDLRMLSEGLAARKGRIVPLQLRKPDGYVLDWLVEEVSLSINTTAAGGNASLMTIA